MLPLRALLLAALLAALVPLPVPAQPQAGEDTVRRQVSEARILSVTTTCFYGPHLEAAMAKGLCARQARGRLLDAAVAQLGAEAELRGSGLPARELRAFVDSLLVVAPLGEETRKLHDGTAVRLTLRGEENPGRLADKLAAFRADGAFRAEALAATASRDRQAAEARLAGVPFVAEREFAAPAEAERLSAETALATRRLVPGMSMASVKGLLGDPGALRQAVIGADSYVCAGYGAIWVVFRDGAVSCVRTRLEYDHRRGTDCHCAGNYATILDTD